MSEKLLCPICGTPTRVYMGNARKDKLCGKHADELKSGKIVKCENCENWHSISDACSCTNKTAEPENKTEKIIVHLSDPKFKNPPSKCLLCENE